MFAWPAWAHSKHTTLPADSHSDRLRFRVPAPSPTSPAWLPFLSFLIWKWRNGKRGNESMCLRVLFWGSSWILTWSSSTERGLEGGARYMVTLYVGNRLGLRGLTPRGSLSLPQFSGELGLISIPESQSSPSGWMLFVSYVVILGRLPVCFLFLWRLRKHLCVINVIFHTFDFCVPQAWGHVIRECTDGRLICGGACEQGVKVLFSHEVFL